MNIKIHLTTRTVKSLQRRLHQVLDRAEKRLVHGIGALLEHLTQGALVLLPTQRWDFGASTFYVWSNELVGDGLVFHQQVD